MKIYFAGSIRGGRDDRELYEQLIQNIQTQATVLTEHIGDANITSDGQRKDSDRFIHDRDLFWLFESDAMIAEVTHPSLGVGYELGRAIENKKPILALHRKRKERKLSAMIAGCPHIQCKLYSDLSEAENHIYEFLKYVEQKKTPL